jgi:hypothetical protein
MPLADTLTILAERIEDESHGLIGRLAIFLDEFDRYVRPLLEGRVDEVDELHGGLRQIVMKSRRLSLVMVGSGLQKLFTEDYARPLWGSIDKVVIHPFDWDHDRDAIKNTLMPEYLRPQLCPDERRFEELARHAGLMCGGEPYSLAMLGYAAARVSRGHHWTPALLNRVADMLAQDQERFNSPEINSSKFYGFIFETLAHLPVRKRAVAKVLLTHIAERTSTDYPELAKWVAVEPPELLRISTEQERQAALTILIQEGALEFNATNSHLRIRVPLTAAALRANAIRERDLALQELKAQ